MKKFGIVDIIIILLVVAMCAAGYFVVSEKKGTSTANISDIEFTVEMKMITKKAAQSFKIGDDVYDVLKGGYYGKVVDVKSNIAKEITTDSAHGKYTVEEYPGKYDAYVTVKGTPTSMTAEDIMFASQKIKVGIMAYLKNDNAVGKGYIVDVKVLNKEAE